MKTPITIRLIFNDLTRKGQSIANTEEYIEHTKGQFHGGSTFPAEIYLDADAVIQLREMLKAGLEPTFSARSYMEPVFKKGQASYHREMRMEEKEEDGEDHE